MSEAEKNQDYYIGLDMGTNSVGWAVTDPEYHLLRKRGQTLWGARLFDEAKPAADRRGFRSSRRRLDRSKNRLKLLRIIFSDEMSKVDPDFYTRLRESFYLADDKNFSDSEKRTKYLLFSTEKEEKTFHQKYPTIWHLRSAIIHADNSTHFDIREYYLAVAHILKNRGHFLFEGDFRPNADGFKTIFEKLKNASGNYGVNLDEVDVDKTREILTDKKTGKRDKQKLLKEIFPEFEKETSEDENSESMDSYIDGLIKLISGSVTSLSKMFSIESEEDIKCNFSDGKFEEKQNDLEQNLEAEQIEIINCAKEVYDFVVLDNVLHGRTYISEAMVDYYDQHKKDLKNLKDILKPFMNRNDKENFDQDIWNFFKKVKCDDKTEICYNGYVGKAYIVSGGRRDQKSMRTDQESLNKKIEKILQKIKENSNSYAKVVDKKIFEELLKRSGEGERSLLPKQKGQAKGTIPEQLHHNELELILNKLVQDFPSFGEITAEEDEEYNTKAKKIAKIHSFRIPYYVGPIKKRKFNDAGEEINKDGSEFSWADEEIQTLVYPWNFDKLVNLEGRANNFIRRMTNDCTYLYGEKVLPKNSLSYQEYMVLNELNNININKTRIDNETKKAIFKKGFKSGELTGNITMKTFRKYLLENSFIGEGDTIEGADKVFKFLPTLKTHLTLKKILGENYESRFLKPQLEDAIEAITILGDEKKMLEKKLAEILPEASENEIHRLAKCPFKDYAKFSDKFLNGIRVKVNNKNGNYVGDFTILEALLETNLNLMELLSPSQKFSEQIDEINHAKEPKTTKITYEDVQNLYCSKAVKRSIWQAVKIVKELVEVIGYAPKKIFLESTRGGSDKQKGRQKFSRKKQLVDKYKKAQETKKEIFKELDDQKDQAFQNRALYLYFSQMGKCAYCEKPISLEDIGNKEVCDLDHIYPQSKIKDDSLTNNMVLAHRECNAKKSNIYPLSADIRQKKAGEWAHWFRIGLISEEKYKRLTRTTEFTDEELAGFISRQIVETSQAVKAARDLFRRAYPGANVVLTKAGITSDLRNFYGYDEYDYKKDGDHKERIKKRDGFPEFIKVRDLNDFHHAKDAYLNIVTGNVMSETFTDNPFKWLKMDPKRREYTINVKRNFRLSEYYNCKNKAGKIVPTRYPIMKGWNYQASFDIVSKTMKRNDCLWTRMTKISHGALGNLQPAGKLLDQKKKDGLLPLKNDPRLSKTNIYGGYNSLSTTFFALIDFNGSRRIVQVPIVATKPQDYLSETYPDCKIIMLPIKVGSKMRINGFPVILAGKTGDKLSLLPALQVYYDDKTNAYLKRIMSVCRKIDEESRTKQVYKIDRIYDGVDEQSNLKCFDAICEKLELFRNMPEFNGKIPTIRESRSKLEELSFNNQCKMLHEMMKITKCNAEKADLSLFISKAGNVGKSTINNKLDGWQSAELILQSTTGLFEKKIDLKTIQPKDVPTALKPERFKVKN